MKQKIYSFVVLLTICLTLISPAHIKAVSAKQTTATAQFNPWYLQGYSDGYDDAVNNRPFGYTLMRTLIPEWEFCNYKDGYDQGWADGGGGTNPMPGCGQSLSGL
jgi:hypothetical protein